MKKFLNKRVFWFIIIPALFVILFLFILLKGFSDKGTKSKLPEPPASLQMSKPVAKQIQVAITEAGKNPTSESLGQLGMIYHSNTFYSEAKECYLLAIRANPNDWRWNYYLGYLFSELGEVENAVNHYRKVIELNPGDVYASYYLGEALVKQGNPEEAEKIFSNLAASDKTDFMKGDEVRNHLYPLKVYVQLSLARLLETSSRMDPAIEILKELITDYPDYGPAYRLLANIYAQQGKEKLSTENNQRANELCQFIPLVDPRIAQLALLSRSDEYILKQIDIAAFTSNQEWAKKLLDHALVFMPDNPFLNSKSIQFYLLYGFGDDINKKIDKHYSSFSNDFNELAKLASLFNKNGKYGWALMYYERCAVLKPGDTTILHNLAINYSNVGDAKKADVIIEKLLKDQPDDLKFLADAASIYTQLGENGKAQEVIRRIENLTPNDPVINKLKAGIALHDDNYQLADNYYSRYLQKVPNDIEALQYLGLRYIETKSWNKAINHYKNALGYFPNNPVFLEKLGSIYYDCPDIKLRDLTQAGSYLERAYFSIKSSIETRVSAGKNLAGIFAGEKKWEKAISIINTTLIMATRGNLPEQDIKLLTKTMEDYQINSLNKK